MKHDVLWFSINVMARTLYGRCFCLPRNFLVTENTLNLDSHDISSSVKRLKGQE